MSSPQTVKGEPFLERDQFTVAIKCHWCGHHGMSMWEEKRGTRQLVSLDGFCERLARKEPFRIETVCGGCGKAQPI